METVKEKLVKLVHEGERYYADKCKEYGICKGCPYDDPERMCGDVIVAEYLLQNGVTIIPKSGIGDMSDGYHTFNELYHHRALLFATICNMHPDKAWKAKKHDDGSMYDGMFIVGIETASGQATYHYDIEPYWDVFHVRELEKAPVWDGHTPEEALQRITTLQNSDKWVSVDEPPKEDGKYLVCTAKNTVYCAKYHAKGKFFGTDMHTHITHWMPLPEPPKGDNSNE